MKSACYKITEKYKISIRLFLKLSLTHKMYGKTPKYFAQKIILQHIIFVTVVRMDISYKDVFIWSAFASS